MPEVNKWKRGCPGKCESENPEIINAPENEIPPSVRRIIGDENVFKCLNCCTYWIEPTDKVYKIRHKIIGYHERVSGHDTDYWLMDNRRFQKIT